MSTTSVAAPAKAADTAKPEKVKETSHAHWTVKLAVAFIVFLWTVPAIGVIVTSFRPESEANATGWWTVLFNPSQWGLFTFSNYKSAIVDGNMGQAFINSLAIALPATFIPILIASFAAYAFAFMQFPGRDALFFLIVGLLVVPNWVAFVPLQRVYDAIGMSGTFPAVWLAHVGFGMSLAIYLLRNYMSTLPKEVIESAKVDGASHYTTFYRLILPMSTPVLASFAIFQFLWVWNDLMVALIFLGPGDNAPLTVTLTNQMGQMGQGWNLVAAGGLVMTILPIIVFLSLQRFFVRGLTAGSVKG